MRLPHDWYDEPLPANVRLGERSWIYSSFAFLHHRSTRPDAVRIGDDSGVYHGSFFETGPDAEVEIGRFCTVAGPKIRTDGRVRIGDHTFISYDVVIADDVVAVPPGAGPGAAPRGVEIESEVWIGARAVVAGGARLGRGAVVAAGAVVDFDVPEYAVVAGNPGRVVGSAPPGLAAREDAR